MDFPSQYPDSPAKPLSGPARARLAARQTRTSSLKPYSRRTSAAAQPSGLTPSNSSTEVAVPQPQTQTPKRSLAPPPGEDARSPFSSLRSASPLALLGSVGKAISRPLSWLASSSSAAKSDPQGMPFPQSSSTNSLASIARRRAAHEASQRTQPDDAEREAPSLAARAVGARLAAGVLGSSQPRNDIESQSGAQQDQMAGPALRRSARTAARSALSPPPPPSARPVASSSRISQANEAAGLVSSPPTRSRTSRRVLDLGRDGDPDDSQMELLKSRSPSPAASAVSAKARLRLSVGQSSLAGSSKYATVGYRRGSSLRPDDSAETRLTPSQSSPSFAFGYGSERRLARSSFGLPPNASPFQLATRSPLAPRAGRSSLGPSFGSDLGASPDRFRSGSAGPASFAGGSYRATSPAVSGSTPKRRDWGALGLAAPPSPGPGNDMMREYLATRALPVAAPRSLGMNVFTDPRSSRASSVLADETMSLTPSKLGKRDADMSIDGEEGRPTPVSARKRQMVWHPELGFISQEELRARQPKPPSPKNEAERLLNVLESMRGGSRLGQNGTSVPNLASSRMLQPVPVPAPVSDRSSTVAMSGKAADRARPVSLAPYSRALRKSKLVQDEQTADERLSLRAKLRLSRPVLDHDVPEDVEAGEERQTGTEAGKKAESDSESEVDAAPPPPKRSIKPTIRRSRRLRARDGHESNEDEEMEEAEATKDKPKAKAGTSKTQLRAVEEAEKPKRAQAPTQVERAAAAVSKPTSQRISLAAAKPAATPAAAPKKDSFAVRTSSDADGLREKSSLRQGAAKKFRTHQSSGRISAWEEDLDDDEDLPDADDLSKIKLPTNLFPSGFSFGGGASVEGVKPSSTSEKAAEPAAKSAPATSTPVFASGGAPAKDGATESNEDKTAPVGASESSSLLGRLGGFSAGASNPPEGSTAGAKSPLASGFSFTAPAKANSTPALSFSFRPPPKPMEDAQSATPAAPATAPGPSKPTVASSDFFSTPVEPVKATLDEKKSGPVPNFFGSALAKADAKPAEPSQASVASSSGPPSFSFGKPSSGTPSFGGFGQPATPLQKRKEPTEPAPSFSFGSSVNAGQAEEKAREGKPAPAPASSFSFGQPAASAVPAADTGTGSFSFGSGPEKRSTEAGSGNKDEAEPAAKKVASPSFSFGAPKVSGVSSNVAPLGGLREPASSSAPVPAAATDGKADQPPSKVPNFFGSAGTTSDPPKPSQSKEGSPFPSAAASAATTNSSSFSFGKPAVSAPSFGDSKPTSSTGGDAPKPAFTFGSPAATTPSASSANTGGFTFGTPTSSAAPGTASAAPSFSGFGTPAQPQVGNSEMMEDSPTAAGSGSASASQPKFTFGASASNGAMGSTNAAASLGASSGGASVNGPGVSVSKPMTFSFGAPASPAAGAGSSTPSTPKFGAAPLPSSSNGMFGSPAPAPATATGTSAPSMSFTFGSPASSSTQPSAVFGGSAANPAAPTSFGSTPSSPALFTFGAPMQQQQQQQQQQPPSTSFTFGTPSTNSGASQQPGGFSFGAGTVPTTSPSVGSGGGGGGGNGMFAFGSQPTSTTPSGAPAPFTFGASTAQPSTPGGSGSPFAFNAATPAAPSFGAAQQQDAGTPPGSAGGLFNMGAAPAAGPGPGGRAIKPLRQRRRN